MLVNISNTCHITRTMVLFLLEQELQFAGMAELADALDLGSSG